MPEHSSVVEDYLKAVWALQQADSPVATSRIAERLDLTPAAVSAMIKRLAEQKLLRHEPYRGVTLSPAGELAALRIIRRHRVLELFLTETLGYPWDRVHDEAERLEHAASDELIERLAKFLGEPERDPHGALIPTAEGTVAPEIHPNLATLEPGTWGTVVEVTADEAEQLRYLGSLDLFPGAEVRVEARAPFDGPVTVDVNGEPRTLARSLSRQILVRVEGLEDPAPTRSGRRRT